VREEFLDAILENLALMCINTDRASYTSDYLEQLCQSRVKMTRSGNAYAEDAAKQVMDEQRRDRKKRARVDESKVDTLARYTEIQTASAKGQIWFIRTKIQYGSQNGALRDPVIYRCIVTSTDESWTHQPSLNRNGMAWKI
jgi:glutamyl-tRNA synthetase